MRGGRFAGLGAGRYSAHMPQPPTELPSDPAAVARIRRVTVSGAIDAAVRVVHDDPRSVLLVAITVAAAPIAISLYLAWPATDDLAQAFAKAGEGRPVDLITPLKRFALETLPLLFLAYRVAEPLALGALVTLSARLLTGQPTSTRSAIVNSLRCSVALIVMWLLRWLCIQVGTVFCYVPGILLAGLFFTALPALVVEQIGPFRAFSRSVELNKNRLGEAVLLVLLLGLIEILLAPIAQILPRNVPQAVGIGLVHSGILVLYAAASTVFYFSGRCQFEDLDLQVWVRTVARRDELDPPADGTTLFSPQPTA